MTATQPRNPRKWPWIVGVIAVLAAVSIGGAFLRNQPARTAATIPPVASTSAATESPAAVQPATVLVPTDLVGDDAGVAASELAQLGLAPDVVAESPACGVNGSLVPSGCAVVAVPGAGERVSGGSDVRLVVDMSSPATTTTDAPTDDTVTYTITGHRSGTITYTNAGGDISQVTDTTKLPWTISFTVPAGTEDFLSVSAQNAGSGTIGCSISINGQVAKQNTSTGTYAIVDCSD